MTQKHVVHLINLYGFGVNGLLIPLVLRSLTSSLCESETFLKKTN